MAQFSVVRSGYDKKEVELYVDKLKAQLDLEKSKNKSLSEELELFKKQATEMKEKGENISIALTAAVEKAKQIEKSSTTWSFV